MSDERQLRFDLGVCDAIDGALQEIIDRENANRRISEAATSTAMRSVREARRRRLERQKVRLVLSDLDAGAFLFDGRRTFERDKCLDWRVRARGWTDWMNYPLVGVHDADLGDAAIERLVIRVRAMSLRANGRKWRPPYNKLFPFSLMDDASGRYDDDLDEDHLAMAMAAIAERDARRARHMARG